jgi:hypothetical protein
MMAHLAITVDVFWKNSHLALMCALRGELQLPEGWDAR